MVEEFVTQNLKLQMERAARFHIVSEGSLTFMKFPENDLVKQTMTHTDISPELMEDLINQTMTHTDISPEFKRYMAIIFNNIIKDETTENTERILEAICRAVQVHSKFPFNNDEFSELLWDTIEDITRLIICITPIIVSSQHNSLMRSLYLILMQNQSAILKLLEYEEDGAPSSLFEEVYFKLSDNVITCNRILLASCYVQNSYQTVNAALDYLITLSERFETLVAFLATVALKSASHIINYIPTGYVIRQLKCHRCRNVVSLSGCVCTIWELDTITPSRAELYMDPCEDGACTSSHKVFK